MRIYFTILTLLLFALNSSQMAFADKIVQVMDDRRNPIKGIVFVNGTGVDETNDSGVLVLSDDECTVGSAVTAEPSESQASFLQPSSSGRCLNNNQPIEVVLTRRVIVFSVEKWLEYGEFNQDWGVVAHSANELYWLGRTHPELSADAEGYKLKALQAGARVVGLDPESAVVFDSSAGSYVMSSDFQSGLKIWKSENNVSGGTGVLDLEFFKAASSHNSADLYYDTPN